MLVSPALSLSSVSFNNNGGHPKFSPTHVYCRQQHQIIELVECTAPPPRNIASVIHDSDYSSSYSSSDDDDDSDQEDEAATSYCSSDVPPEPSDSAPIPSGEGDSLPIELASDSYSSTKRILAWRENFANDFGTAFIDPSSSPLSLKRKLDIEDDADSRSQTSKRSRSQASQGGASVDMHPCPACDACFLTRQDLRQHGRDAQANEACCVAVEYAFE